MLAPPAPHHHHQRHQGTLRLRVIGASPSSRHHSKSRSEAIDEIVTAHVQEKKRRGNEE